MKYVPGDEIGLHTGCNPIFSPGTFRPCLCLRRCAFLQTHVTVEMQRRLLEAELDEIRRETARREEEKSAAVEAAEELRRQKKELREAIRCESENFRKLQSTLADERARTKSAADRDSETIIELRTSLEVEREQKLALEREIKSPPGKKKKQDLDIVIVDVSKCKCVVWILINLE